MVVTKADILQDLTVQRDYLGCLTSLAAKRFVDQYKKDIEPDLTLRDEEYKITPDLNLFKALRERTTRTYAFSLTDILSDQEHPFGFDLSGIKFSVTFKPKESGEEYIDFRTNKYFFENANISLGDAGKAVGFLDWIPMLGIDMLIRNDAEQQRKVNQELLQGSRESLREFQGELETGTNPFEILAYRIITKALERYFP